MSFYNGSLVKILRLWIERRR